MKSVIAHGVLALLGLLFAYRTWTHEEKEERPTGEVAISECDASKLATIQIETSSHTVTFRAQHGGEKPEFWVTTQSKKLPEEKTDKPVDKAGDKTADKKPDDKKPDDKKPDDKKPDDKNAKPAEPEKAETPKQARAYEPEAPVTFLASPKFQEALKTLAPLRAPRKLGEIPKAKWKEFGLDKSTIFLREECGGQKIELEAGGRTFGSGDQYVRDKKTNQVYLLHGQMLMDLQSAMYRFMQTDLNRFTLADVDEAVVKAGDKERKLLHRNRQAPEALWVDAAAPDKRNELFGNWFQRLARLKAKSYLGEGKEPGSDLQIEVTATTPVVTIDYRTDGKPKGKFELVRVDTKQGNFYYARTETTQRWTVMYDSLAKQIEDDAAMVVGREQPAKESTPAVTPATPAGVPGSAAAPATKPGAAPASAPHGLPPSHPPIH